MLGDKEFPAIFLPALGMVEYRVGCWLARRGVRTSEQLIDSEC